MFYLTHLTDKNQVKKGILQKTYHFVALFLLLFSDNSKIIEVVKKIKRILIVDDDPDVLSAIRMLLEIQNFSVKTASRGEQIEALCMVAPDLILMDVWLGAEDGRLIAQRLKRQKATKHIPILMMSSHPTVYKTITDYNVDGFIAKPFDVEVLVKKINNYL